LNAIPVIPQWHPFVESSLLFALTLRDQGIELRPDVKRASMERVLRAGRALATENRPGAELRTSSYFLLNLLRDSLEDRDMALLSGESLPHRLIQELEWLLLNRSACYALPQLSNTSFKMVLKILEKQTGGADKLRNDSYIVLGMLLERSPTLTLDKDGLNLESLFPVVEAQLEAVSDRPLNLWKEPLILLRRGLERLNVDHINQFGHEKLLQFIGTRLDLSFSSWGRSNQGGRDPQRLGPAGWEGVEEVVTHSLDCATKIVKMAHLGRGDEAVRMQNFVAILGRFLVHCDTRLLTITASAIRGGFAAGGKSFAVLLFKEMISEMMLIQSEEGPYVHVAAEGLYHLIEELLISGLEEPSGFIFILEALKGEVVRGGSATLQDVLTEALIKVVSTLMKREFNSAAAAMRAFEVENQSMRVEMRACLQQLTESQRESEELRRRLKQQEAESQLMMDSLVCAVCLESFMGRDPIAFDCGHIYCKQCTVSLAGSQKCPICRAPIGQARMLRGLG